MAWVFAVTSLLLLFLSGGALVGALALSRRARLELDHRITLVATASEASSHETVDKAKNIRLSSFDILLRRIFAVGVGHFWGMSANAVILSTAAIATGAAAWAILRFALGLSIWFSVPVTLLATFLAPRTILLRQQRKADRAFTDLFPSAIDSIARMLRAGLPIATAVQSVGDEGPPPVNAVFTKVANQVQIGAPIDAALDATSQQIGLPDFRFFAVAVALQHATGGNLAATLEILSEIVRKRREVRQKAKAATSEIRVTAYVVGSLPILIFGALQLIQPGYLSPLFADPRGHVVLGIAVGLLLLTGISMRQMMRSVTN